MPKTTPYTDLVIRSRVIVVVAALIALIATAAPQAQGRRRAMYVSVVDAQGAPVAGLGPADFVVHEDGVAREVLTAAPADDPMQVALVVDNSQAARSMIQDLRLGLQGFIDAMTAPSDGRKGANAIAIVTIADRPTIATDYTSDRAALTRGVGRIFAQPDSGMYLLDALVDVLHGFDKRGATRPVIVAVLTEGIEFSTRYYTDVTKPLAESGAPLYAFSVGQPATDLRDETRNRSYVLSEGTKASGGEWDILVSSLAIPARLKQLADQLTHAYRITYGHPESLVPPSQVTVDVKRPGVTAHGTLVREPQP